MSRNLIETYDVVLTEEQYQRAARVGTRRYNESKRRNFQQAFGAPGYDLDSDIIGAAGELAYCIYTNQDWSESVNTFKAPDVGCNVQVRTTKKKSLIVRKNDKDSDFFVLVIANDRQFKIVGGIFGRDAKQDEFLFGPNDRPDAWFVSQSALTRIEDRRICPECQGRRQIFIEDLDCYIACSRCNPPTPTNNC